VNKFPTGGILPSTAYCAELSCYFLYRRCPWRARLTRNEKALGTCTTSPHLVPLIPLGFHSGVCSVLIDLST
jgi:hypothetical protein